MGLVDRSIYAGIFIIFIAVLRVLNLHIIPKTTYLLLWKITMVRMLVPIAFPIDINRLGNLTTRFSKIQSAAGNREGYFLIKQNGIQYDADIAIGNKPFDLSWKWMAIWLTGMILILIIYTLKYVHGLRLIREAIPVGDEAAYAKARLAGWAPKRHIRLLSMDRITSPFTAGMIHPKIILPKSEIGHNSSGLNYILIHEFVHIVRNDNLWKTIAIISVSVHWFNPMSWLMYYLLQRDMEIACDEKVISIIGDRRKTEYALTLVRLAERQSVMTSIYSSFGKNSIEERMVSIMKHKNLTHLGLVLSLVLVLLAGTTFLTYANANANEKSDYNPLYDPSVNKELYISEVREKNEEARQYYPVNENGYTYGPDIYGLVDAGPDLVAVENEDGISGYCYESDIAPTQVSTKDALAFMNEWKNGRNILIYESNGETVIGIFRISPGITR